MNTPNLDALLEKAAQECPGLDGCTCEARDVRDELFRDHGPALVAVLKELLEYKGIIEERCDAVATTKAAQLLTLLDQEATL